MILGNPQINLFGLGIEFFSLILIIFSSFLIFYKTKKVYELTEHKGIKYFRRGFLFFALAYILRIITFFLEPPFHDSLIDKNLGFLFSSIFHLIAISYLFASMHYKKVKEYFIYLGILLFGIIGFIFREPMILGLIVLTLFIGFGVSSIIKYKNSKKRMFSQIYFIYVLFFLFWVFLAFTQSLAQVLRVGKFLGGLLTAAFFMYLAYLVMHKLNPNPKEND